MSMQLRCYIGSAFCLISSALMSGTMSDTPVSSSSGSYIRADLGYNFFNKAKATTSDVNNLPSLSPYANIENNWGYNFGAGYKLSQYLRTDLDFTYRPSIKSTIQDSVPEFGQGSFDNYTLMLNGYLDIDFHALVTPYLSAGFGISSNTTSAINWPVVQQNEYGQSTQTVVWQVGAGLSYAIQSNLLIDFNYNFIDLGKIYSTGHFDVDPVAPFLPGRLGVPTLFETQYASQLQLGLRYCI